MLLTRLSSKHCFFFALTHTFWDVFIIHNAPRIVILLTWPSAGYPSHVTVLCDVIYGRQSDSPPNR